MIKTIDGIKVYGEDWEYIAYFDDWLEANGYEKQESMRDRYLSTGMDEEEFDNMMNELMTEFEEWANNNDLIAETV